MSQNPASQMPPAAIQPEDRPTDVFGPRRWPVTLICALAAITFLGSLAGATLLLRWYPARVMAPLAAVLLLGYASALGMFVALLQHRRRWQRPLAELANALRDIRAGDAPIEELARIQGPLAQLANEVADTLRELRRQKALLAAAQQEMRQRIAQRTDALERTIGSLQVQANRDPLTGLYNRRMLERHLGQVVARMRQEQRALCVLMLDLDNFKLLNDTHGHAAGDDLLRSVGQIIRSTLRDNDLAFRCGGDEFVIALIDADTQGAHSVARRLGDLIDGLGRTLKLARPVGLSVGMACLADVDNPTAGRLLEVADQDLYRFKRQRKAALRKSA